MHKLTIVLLSISFVLLFTSSILFISQYNKDNSSSKIIDNKEELAEVAYTESNSYSDNGDADSLFFHATEPALPRNSYALFIVLDDAGMSLDNLQKFESFEGNYTIAVIPRLQESKIIAKYLANKNIPYIVHLPMESEGDVNEGEFAISVENSDEANLALLAYNLSEFNNYIGLNNHMGSKATRDIQTVDLVLSNIPSDIFVLDSRTTKHTVLAARAQHKDIPVIIRDVFLDNYDDYLYIKNQLNIAVGIAKEKGYAVIIGHSTKQVSAEVLIDMHDAIIADGGIFLGLDKYFSYTSALESRVAQH